MTTRLLGAVLFLSLVATLSPAVATEQETAPEAPAAPEASEPAEGEQPERVSPQIILETQKPPLYPPAAFAARYTAAVRLEIVVLTDGTVGDVKVLDCTRPKMGFEDAAMAAVKNWRFVPGRVGEEPAEVTLRFRLNFVPGGVSLASETIPGGTSPSTSTGSATSFK